MLLLLLSNEAWKKKKQERELFVDFEDASSIMQAQNNH